jgi:hypothetical protein
MTGPVTCSSWDVSRKEGSLSSISRTRSLAIETSYGAGIFQSVSATPKFLSISVNQHQHKCKTALPSSLGSSSSRRIFLRATADVSSVCRIFRLVDEAPPHPWVRARKRRVAGSPRRVDDPLQPKLSAAWQLSRWTLSTLIEYSIAFTSIPLSQSA